MAHDLRLLHLGNRHSLAVVGEDDSVLLLLRLARRSQFLSLLAHTGIAVELGLNQFVLFVCYTCIGVGLHIFESLLLQEFYKGLQADVTFLARFI